MYQKWKLIYVLKAQLCGKFNQIWTFFQLEAPKDCTNDQTYMYEPKRDGKSGQKWKK